MNIFDETVNDVTMRHLLRDCLHDLTDSDESKKLLAQRNIHLFVSFLCTAILREFDPGRGERESQL